MFYTCMLYYDRKMVYLQDTKTVSLTEVGQKVGLRLTKVGQLQSREGSFVCLLFADTKPLTLHRRFK